MEGEELTFIFVFPNRLRPCSTLRFCICGKGLFDQHFTPQPAVAKCIKAGDDGRRGRTNCEKSAYACKFENSLLLTPLLF